MNLYLKYRPKTIDELDLTKVRESLIRVIKSGKMAHAYLFTGPRGAGKTSAARILARVVNCEKSAKKLTEPCNQCDACKSILDGSAMDVIEVDAASNRGIDDVRELKEKIGLAPSILRKKVYIIDEVHMMTMEAFNALLKTLEEPPEHVMFVLCTTEAHKVPETIKSRCSRVLFTKATPVEMLRSFERVVKGEKAKVSREALELLAESVDGSFRDGIKILDRVLMGDEEVGVTQMEGVLSGMSGYSVVELTEALIQKSMLQSLERLREGVSGGVSLSYLLVELMKEIRDRVIERNQVELVQLVYLIDKTLTKLAESPVPEILVEMMIVEWCKDVKQSQTSENGGGKPSSKVQSSQKKELELSRKKIKVEAQKIEPKSELKSRLKVEYQGSVTEVWQKLAKTLHESEGSFSLGALLAKARPRTISGDLLIIEVEYDFHKTQIMQEKHRMRIEKLISEVVGKPMRINCEVMGRKLQSNQNIDRITQVSTEETSIDSMMEIFTN